MKRYDPCDRGSRGAGLIEAIDGEVFLYSDVAPLVEAFRAAPDIMNLRPEEFYIAYGEWHANARAALKRAEGGE